jgi:transcription initiation factor IIE alpha subunit
MSEITDEEKFIVERLKEKGGKLNYKELQNLCEEKFEGVRLILKKLKEKGIVDYEGMIPGFSAKIELLKEI